MEAVFGRIFGASPRQLATSVSPNHRAVSSSVSQRVSKRYWSLFVGLQETETTYLAVEKSRRQRHACRNWSLQDDQTFQRYLPVSISLHRSKMMYLPVKQLHSRAESLYAKFEHGEGTRYIDEAIDLDRRALELCPPSQFERPVSSILLSLHLDCRYSQLGAARDLEEVIVLAREALSLCPQGHPYQSVVLNNALYLHLVR